MISKCDNKLNIDKNYFYLFTYCYFVQGIKNDIIYDTFKSRIFRLNRSPFKEIMRHLQKGLNIHEIASTTKIKIDEVRHFLTYLQSLDYGTFYSKSHYAESFRPIVLFNQEQYFSIRRSITTATIEISSKCTFNCSFCKKHSYTSSSSCLCGIWANSSSQTMIDYSKLIPELYLLGCTTIIIKGGDPFLYKNKLYKIIKTARHHNMKIMIQTTGVNIDLDDIKYLLKEEIELIIPIFSNNQDVYNSTSMIPGSFERLQKLVKNYSKNCLIAQIILTDKTIEKGHEIIRPLLDNGIKRILMDYCLSNDYLYNAIDNYEESALSIIYKTNTDDYIISIEKFMRQMKGHSCWQDSIAIDIHGNVLPCIASRNNIMGNLNNESLFDIIGKGKDLKSKKMGKDNNQTCKECEFRYCCTYCSISNIKMFRNHNEKAWNCLYNPIKGEWDKDYKKTFIT